jgi:hypothetical protein
MLDTRAILRFAFHDQQKCSWTASALQGLHAPGDRKERNVQIKADDYSRGAPTVTMMTVNYRCELA